MRRTYTRRNRPQPTAEKGISRRKLLIAGGTVTATYSGLLAYTTLTPPQPAEAESASNTRHVMVLLDTTDPYTPSQNRLIDQWVGPALRRTLAHGDQLELFQLQDTGLPVRCLFNETSPKRGHEMSRAFGDPDRQEQVWQRTFWQPFESAVSEARSIERQRTSPLVEGLFEMSRTLRHSRAKRKHIWIVSDGLQYSGKSLSAYNETLYREDADYWQSYPAEFAGAEIRFLYLYRPDKSKFQTARHRDWINHWFSRAGAGGVEIIQG